MHTRLLQQLSQRCCSSNLQSSLEFWIFIFALFYRRVIRQPRHPFDEVLRVGVWQSRPRGRPLQTHSILVGLRVATRSRRRPQAILHVRCQTILPTPSGSPGLFCLRGHRYHDLPKTARKLEKEILLKQVQTIDQSPCQVPEEPIMRLYDCQKKEQKQFIITVLFKNSP